MKKSTLTLLLIVAVLIVGGVLLIGRSGSGTPTTPGTPDPNQPGSVTVNTPSASVTATTKVSSHLSEYKNAELGFSVNYPSEWEKDDTDNGVAFIMPIDKNQVSTVAKLEADIIAQTGKCDFPPVTTIKDRSTITVSGNTLNMISMSNSVQGRGYFNRMYSLQHGGVCYFFTFSSITQSPTSKNLSGSNLIQAQNNNKAIVNSADSAFTDMVKTFEFVTLPTGVDETQAAPKK